MGMQIDYAFPSDPDISVGWLVEARNHAHRGCFAGPTGAEQRQKFSAGKSERNVVNYPGLAKDLCQMFNLKAGGRCALFDHLQYPMSILLALFDLNHHLEFATQ